MPSAEHDVVTQGWAAITVRVAWTLRTEGVRQTRDRVRDAREHVFWHLEPQMSVHLAEDLAERLVREWVARAEGRPWRPRFPEDDDHPLPQRWRDALFVEGQPKIADLVLRHHYADGIKLHKLASKSSRTPLDRPSLEAAREGLREAVREVAREEGRPIDGWSDDRLDDLIHRLAQVARQPAPSLLDVVDGQRPQDVKRCVRCRRAFKLVTGGTLARADLVPPPHRARPSGMMQVVALQFRPEVRSRRSRLRDVFPASFPMGDDLLLVHAPVPATVFRALRDRALTSWPTRDDVRGASMTLGGRWSPSGPLGPGPKQVPGALRGVRWGSIDGLGELPAPLPPPPSAAPWWALVLALGVLTFLVGRWALEEGAGFAPQASRLDVEVVEARQGMWVDFDVDDLARVVLLMEERDGPRILLSGRSAAEKAAMATGDGRYRVHLLADRALIAQVSRAVAELPGLVDGARQQAAPLDTVARELARLDPHADVRLLGGAP